jgi:hypothetical protein
LEIKILAILGFFYIGVINNFEFHFFEIFIFFVINNNLGTLSQDGKNLAEYKDRKKDWNRTSGIGFRRAI